MGTRVELVEDLLKEAKSFARDRIILMAKRGMYHDYTSMLITPKRVLVIDLENAGYDHLAEEVKRGKYDEKWGEK